MGRHHLFEPDEVVTRDVGKAEFGVFVELAIATVCFWGWYFSLDGQLGRLIEALKKSGRYTSSLIVILSDHGEDLNQHGEPIIRFDRTNLVRRRGA